MGTRECCACPFPASIFSLQGSVGTGGSRNPVGRSAGPGSGDQFQEGGIGVAGTGAESERGSTSPGSIRIHSSGRGTFVGWVLGIGLLAALALLVHSAVGWSQLLAPWGALSFLNLLLALGLTFLSHAVRSVRLQRYFYPDTRGSYLRTFRVQLLHNLFNNLLPMRSGEASFPILMKRNFRVPLTRSLPGLLFLRLLDLHFLLFIGIVGMAWGGTLETWFLVVLFAPIPLLGFLAQDSLKNRLDPATGRGEEGGVNQGACSGENEVSGHQKTGLPGLIRRSLDGFPATRRLFWGIWLLTGVNWTVKLLVFAWVLVLFSPMPYLFALLGTITGELSSVLPVHGIAGAGTYEAGIMLGLLPGDMDVRMALAGAVNLHLFVLGTSILFGVVALLIPRGPVVDEGA